MRKIQEVDKQGAVLGSPAIKINLNFHHQKIDLRIGVAEYKGIVEVEVESKVTLASDRHTKIAPDRTIAHRRATTCNNNSRLADYTADANCLLRASVSDYAAATVRSTNADNSTTYKATVTTAFWKLLSTIRNTSDKTSCI